MGTISQEPVDEGTRRGLVLRGAARRASQVIELFDPLRSAERLGYTALVDFKSGDSLGKVRQQRRVLGRCRRRVPEPDAAIAGYRDQGMAVGKELRTDRWHRMIESCNDLAGGRLP